MKCLLQSQVPKSVPAEVKQAKAVEWFRQSLAAHSFKDLEKAIPTVVSINRMQVKDFIQALTDEGLIRVEKIGGGNWYWSFPSDAKKINGNILSNLMKEETKLQASISDIDIQIQKEMAAREEDEDMLEDGGIDRKALLGAYERLLEETAALAKELDAYSDSDPTEILRLAGETKMLKESAEKWTDYIEAVEGLFKNITGDRAAVALLMENICGDEYVPGEGLKEL